MQVAILILEIPGGVGIDLKIEMELLNRILEHLFSFVSDFWKPIEIKTARIDYSPSSQFCVS